jgi:hypothetical protein
VRGETKKDARERFLTRTCLSQSSAAIPSPGCAGGGGGGGARARHPRSTHTLQRTHRFFFSSPSTPSPILHRAKQLQDEHEDVDNVDVQAD